MAIEEKNARQNKQLIDNIATTANANSPKNISIRKRNNFRQRGIFAESFAQKTTAG